MQMHFSLRRRTIEIRGGLGATRVSYWGAFLCYQKPEILKSSDLFSSYNCHICIAKLVAGCAV